MAIKSSNQITFTEQKKIIEIKEWYLAAAENTGITIETEGWTTDIQTIDYTNKYLWNYEKITYTDNTTYTTENYTKNNPLKALINFVIKLFKVIANLFKK